MARLAVRGVEVPAHARAEAHMRQLALGVSCAPTPCSRTFTPGRTGSDRRPACGRRRPDLALGKRTAAARAICLQAVCAATEGPAAYIPLARGAPLGDDAGSRGAARIRRVPRGVRGRRRRHRRGSLLGEGAVPPVQRGAGIACAAGIRRARRASPDRVAAGRLALAGGILRRLSGEGARRGGPRARRSSCAPLSAA